MFLCCFLTSLYLTQIVVFADHSESTYTIYFLIHTESLLLGSHWFIWARIQKRNSWVSSKQPNNSLLLLWLQKV